ncbi:serine O-acetyltransferase [Rhodopseudomonas palustris]|uniref:serine O-acetyltransferase n=1 Tax=Rhodopseudomonas palustris TaxID=1076 RepID=UPI0020CD750C|nr:serine O-acetyltransferase [Rhodopseudomonas palustris]MCP9627512.1 serine O-acetyltransferase [Rhodopseudomonas palustris]
MHDHLLKAVNEIAEREVGLVAGPSAFAALANEPSRREQVLGLIVDDVLAYEAKDPASRGRLNVIMTSRPSFKCIMFHRIAHALFPRSRELAEKLASAAFLETGIDIHPAASIGSRFVLDHGWGTVIGETTIIGQDCYLLGCAILGARGIANNASGKRHPTLGNRVEVGGHARILGDITIGDDCFIAPYSSVTQDIPSNSKVVIINQLQICQHKPDHPHVREKPADALVVRGVVRYGNNLVLQTHGAAKPALSVVTEDDERLMSLPIHQIGRDGGLLVWSADARGLDAALRRVPRAHLLLQDGGKRVLVLDAHRLQRPEPMSADTINAPLSPAGQHETDWMHENAVRPSAMWWQGEKLGGDSQRLE